MVAVPETEVVVKSSPELLGLMDALEKFNKALEGGTVKTVACPEGATVVLRHPEALSPKAHEKIRRSAMEVFPNRRVIVLEEGLDLSVLDDSKSEE